MKIQYNGYHKNITLCLFDHGIPFLTCPLYFSINLSYFSNSITLIFMLSDQSSTLYFLLLIGKIQVNRELYGREFSMTLHILSVILKKNY